VSKVSEFNCPVRGQKDVIRFKIAVHQSALVDVRYSFKDLLKESFDVVFVDGQGAISQGSTKVRRAILKNKVYTIPEREGLDELNNVLVPSVGALLNRL